MQKFVILLFTLLFVSISFAQNSPNDSKDSTDTITWNTLQYDIVNILGGIGHAYTRPLHWEGDNWLSFGAVVAGTGIAFVFDDNLRAYFDNQEAHVPDFLQGFGTYYGSPQNNYALTGAVYFTGFLTKNEKLRRTGVLLISSASAAGFLQQVSKSVVGRARPRSGLEKDHFRPFTNDKDFHSFPSGHAVMAFSNAYAIAKQFTNPWVKAGIYGVGIIPGVSRLWRGAHWFSDFALSTVLSIFTVESIDAYLDGKYKAKYNPNTKTISWNFQVVPGKIGLVMSF
ncbi:phosphatase PAP2 family protein [Arenibacter sp. GZD96]|uniref:phosphatase PAP2 family protein n=1 Tax=Aurantibrevibacter litoralis TaxID=3106030 RepID=UPI002AFF3DFC|nr:phosphatase PAP2 family protein [Arenibacter sp. GZD-96]MEA1786163.1 phosphatase PAP2 family protein [Arenibacter sp. GZD-96]